MRGTPLEIPILNQLGIEMPANPDLPSLREKALQKAPDRWATAAGQLRDMMIAAGEHGFTCLESMSIHFSLPVQ
jgi:hypothetical protein